MRFKQLTEGYKILPPMNKEKYQERNGLEGPFQTMAGKVVYYDPKEGKYYDPDTDMYLSYEEFKELDNDRTGIEEQELSEGQTVAVKFYDEFDSANVVHIGDNTLSLNNAEVNKNFQWDRPKGHAFSTAESYVSDWMYKTAKNWDEVHAWLKRIRDTGDEKALLAAVQKAFDTGSMAPKIVEGNVGENYNLPADAAGFRTGTKFRRGGLASGSLDKKTYDREMSAFKQSQTAPKPKAPKMINGPRVAESARGLGSIDWPDVDEDGDSAMMQHAENAIRHGMHAYDAYDHVYSMSRERDWLSDNKDMIINMFAQYGLQTENAPGSLAHQINWGGQNKPQSNVKTSAKPKQSKSLIRRGIDMVKGLFDEEDFSESDAMDKALRSIEKTFNPERQAITDQVMSMVRCVEMLSSERFADRAWSTVERYGINNKQELAQEIQLMIRNEQAIDDDEIKGTDTNIKSLTKALNKLKELDMKISEVAGPDKCWPGYAPGAQSGVKTKAGTGKNKGKRVNNCEPVKKKKGK